MDVMNLGLGLGFALARVEVGEHVARHTLGRIRHRYAAPESLVLTNVAVARARRLCVRRLGLGSLYRLRLRCRAVERIL